MPQRRDAARRPRRLGAARSAAHLALGLPVGLALWGAVLVGSLATLVLLPTDLRTRPADLVLRRAQAFESFRFATILGYTDLAPAQQPWRGFSDPALWRMLTYALLRAPLSVLHALAITALVTVPAGAAAGLVRDVGSGATFLPYWPWLLGLAAAVWLLPALAHADHWLARLLLGTDLAELQRRVGVLVDARRRTVDEADRERERIERDLHDGAQQRLIALSILLGRTEEKLAHGDAAVALASVRQAKDETLAVIAEIRGLTQGLRPAVLETRGLDAALSAVAGRLPLPCRVDVRLDPRPSPTVEAALYFAVAELLTNVVRHADAASASVDVSSDGRTIRGVVRDDGRGGADPSRGSGLRGIADRLAGIEGTVAVSSPAGGPTTVTVEVPCGS